MSVERGSGFVTFDKRKGSWCALVKTISHKKIRRYFPSESAARSALQGMAKPVVSPSDRIKLVAMAKRLDGRKGGWFGVKLMAQEVRSDHDLCEAVRTIVNLRVVLEELVASRALLVKRGHRGVEQFRLLDAKGIGVSEARAIAERMLLWPSKHNANAIALASFVLDMTAPHSMESPF